MNIIQLFNHLAIDKEKLKIFSDLDIIRTEKQINVERKLNPEIDANVANNLINVLKYHRDSLLFILSYRPFFNLFAQKDLPRNTFGNKPVEANENQIKLFIEEFLLDDLMLFFDKQIAANNFQDVFDLLNIKKHIPDIILFKIEKKIHGKVDFAVAKIAQPVMDLSEIDYVQKHAIYKVLNIFASIETDNKIRNLLNPMVVKFNGGYSKEFFTNAMIGMFNYNAFDEDIQKVIADNRNAMLGNSSTNTYNNSGSKVSWKVIGVVIFVLLRILLTANKCSNNSSSSNNFNPENTTNSYNVTDMNEAAYRTTPNFHDYLTNFDKQTAIQNQQIATTKTGQNPFINVYRSVTSDFSNRFKINFTNNSKYDVVVLVNYEVKIPDDFAERKYKIPKAAFLVKSNEQFRIDKDTTQGLIYNFYFGNKLSTFDTKDEAQYKTYNSKPEFRFANLAKNAESLIQQNLIFTNDVEIFDEKNAVTWRMKIK